MKEFKIRCSAIASIMGAMGLTEIQTAKLAELEAKEKRTAAQEWDMLALQTKRDNPELPEGAKSYLKLWAKEQFFGVSKNFESKHTRKGNAMENAAIALCEDVLGWGMTFKNEERFSDDELEGTPDVILAEPVADIKNSWIWSTFPRYEIEIPDVKYWWQLQGYMGLTGKKKAQLVYCLLDATDEMVYEEARHASYKRGHGGEMVDGIFEEFAAQMQYPNISDADRVKVFEFDRNDDAIEKVRQRVKMCRQYLKTLQP